MVHRNPRLFFKLPKNPLFRLLLVNGLAGIGISGLVLAGLLWTNVGRIRDLILTSDNPVLPIVMLAIGLIITLGSVVMGTAIMMLREDEENGGGHGTKIPAEALTLMSEPARVPVRSH